MAKEQKKFKKVRLFKVSRELNVSLDTLVEHLKTEGYAETLTGSGPNASITDEDAYLELLEAFAADKATASRVKEKRAALRAETEAANEAEAEAEAETPEAPVAPAEPVVDAPAPAEEAPVAPATPVIETPAESDETPVEASGAPADEAPRASQEDEAPAKAHAAERPDVPSPEATSPEDATADATVDADVRSADTGTPAAPEPAEAHAAERPDVPSPEATSDEDVPAAEAEAPPPEAAAEAEAPEDTSEPSQEAAQPRATTPAPDEKPDAEAKPEAEAEPAEAVADEDADDEDDIPEDEKGLLTANRYQLAGTKVVGKIDLSSIDDGKRKRKRKRKRTADTPAAKVESTPKSKASPKSSAPARAKRKRGPQVDEADVEQTLQDTLRELEQGASRLRQRRRRRRREERAAERQAARDAAVEGEKVLRVTEFVSAGELANLMDIQVNQLISTLFKSGMIVSINQRLDADTIAIAADEFGFDVEFITEFGAEDLYIEEDDPADLKPRAPVVTVMGHVDHGKTSLLDYIRSANVVAGESGGITQHIGAYSVELKGREGLVTFLDTPGHEAFTAMRARGAQVTDLVILVVAADDAVMPQTIEAINHAKAAEVPLVVAINKMDKNTANPQRVMQQLSDHNVLVEQYGGKVQCAFVSAQTGEGVDDLLDKVLLEAELRELQANPNRGAVGTVIESRLEKGRGNVATVLVQNGTLRVGDTFVAGIYSGRVRAMFDERENRIAEVGPSMPALVLGFDGSPEVGDPLVVLEDEREAKDIAQRRQQIYREQSLRQRKHITLEEIGRRLALGDFQELNLIIKADVGGSVEAVADSLLKLSTEEVAVNIIHSGVGAITESDVMLASASDAVIIGFNVRPMLGARTLAEREEIDIRTYSIIYNAIEDVRDALEGLLSPEETEKSLGTVEVRDIFKVPKAGTVAGCYVLEGRIHRNDRVRLIREGVVIFTGSISSLKRFKDDVREVQNGYECGLSIENFNDIKVGDQVEAFEIVETKRKLEV